MMKAFIRHISGICASLVVFSCTGIMDIDGYLKTDSSIEGTMDAVSDSDGPNNGNTQSGVMTAGQWQDLSEWGFWSELMVSQEYADKASYWEFYTNNRVSVRVKDKDGKAKAGVPVTLSRVPEGEGDTVELWKTVTDNHGMAECWVSPFQKESEVKEENLRISINGTVQKNSPSLSTWENGKETVTNEYVVEDFSKASDAADIAFIVDATGSMSDEISFLKDDLEDIIGQVSKIQTTTTIRTSALFYRDKGDEYETKISDFSNSLSTTSGFVGNQDADGGGDYPEAVHTALEKSLKKLSWNSKARTRVAFMILDAPAHHEEEVIRSLQSSIQSYAEQGIKLIPVAASGVDKNTEFMLRFFAVMTNSTYVFITDDSGVGESHLPPTVGKYEVMPLNSLIVKLINYYLE